MIKRLILISFMYFCTTALALQQSNQPYTGLHTDIPIGQIEGVNLSINIAFPQTPSATSRPVVLLIHGGGFISGSKDSKNKQIQRFAKQGYVAASAMYRLANVAKFPAQIEDIQLAIRFLKTNANRYNIHPEKIIVSGSSAGSYLAAMAGVAGNSGSFADHGLYSDYSATVRAVAIQSAPVGNLSLPHNQQSKIVSRLISPTDTNLNDTLVAMSPMTYLDKDDPPFFISHGDSDPVVPVEMSREFVAALKDIDHDFIYHEVQGGTHSFKKSAPQQAKTVFAEYLAFIEKWAE